MAYWNKRKWLIAYRCKKLVTNLIIRPKWCKESEDRYCKDCKHKELVEEKKDNDKGENA